MLEVVGDRVLDGSFRDEHGGLEGAGGLFVLGGAFGRAEGGVGGGEVEFGAGGQGGPEGDLVGQEIEDGVALGGWPGELGLAREGVAVLGEVEFLVVGEKLVGVDGGEVPGEATSCRQRRI